MDSRELMLGTPPYCRPMIMLRKSSFWVILKACWRMRTKSGLNDLESKIVAELWQRLRLRGRLWQVMTVMWVYQAGSSVGGHSSHKTLKQWLAVKSLCLSFVFVWSLSCVWAFVSYLTTLVPFLRTCILTRQVPLACATTLISLNSAWGVGS